MMTSSSETAAWWQIEAKSNTPEDSGAMLIELGAAGVEMRNDDGLACFFRGDEPELSEFLKSIERLGLRDINCLRVENSDWLKTCLDAWGECRIDALRIIPCLDDSQTKMEKMDLLLKPGMGFGTGLHPTTRTALRMLQCQQLKNAAPKRILDIGTGSGILAIAASMIFDTEVDAAEIDPDAVINARENIALNALSERVKIVEPDLDRLDGGYDLVIANIYAEVLVELEPKIRALLAQSGAVILSGVMAEKKPIIESGFGPELWRTLDHQSVGGWDSFFLRRRQ